MMPSSSSLRAFVGGLLLALISPLRAQDPAAPNGTCLAQLKQAWDQTNALVQDAQGGTYTAVIELRTQRYDSVRTAPVSMTFSAKAGRTLVDAGHVITLADERNQVTIATGKRSVLLYDRAANATGAHAAIGHMFSDSLFRVSEIASCRRLTKADGHRELIVELRPSPGYSHLLERLVLTVDITEQRMLASEAWFKPGMGLRSQRLRLISLRPDVADARLDRSPLSTVLDKGGLRPPYAAFTLLDRRNKNNRHGDL